MLGGIGTIFGRRRVAVEPVAASPTVAAAPGAPARPPLSLRQDALIRSNQLLTDRLTRSRTALEQVRTSFDDPSLSTVARGTTVASAARELGGTLRTVEDLNGQLNQAFGDTRVYRSTLGSATGQTLVNGTRATARVITPVAESAGALADLARAQSQAMRDISEWQRVLADPSATSSARLAATARATQSASKLVTQQHATLAALRAADANYLQNPTYQKIQRSMTDSRAMQAIGRVNGRAVQAAAFTGTAAGAVLGAITLPTAFQGIRTTYDRLATTLADPTATRDQQLGSIADFSRATATTVQGVAGLQSSLVALSDMTRLSDFLGRTIAPSGSVLAQAGQGFSNAMRLLGPVADMGLFVADAVKLRTVFSDPASSGWDRFRAVLALGLDTLKIGSWLLPQTAMLRVATLGISTAQLVLAASDFARMLGPSFKTWGQSLSEALRDPGAALRTTGQSLLSGVTWASSKVVQAADGLAWSVTHPGEAARLAGDRLRQAGASIASFVGVMRDSAAVVQGEAPAVPPVVQPVPGMDPPGDLGVQPSPIPVQAAPAQPLLESPNGLSPTVPVP